MKLDNAIVLITGANRGIGLAFAEAALAAGARKVYAGARKPASITLAGVTPIQLDVTSPSDIAAAAQVAGDVTLVINNAGIAETGSFLAPDAERQPAPPSRSQRFRHPAHQPRPRPGAGAHGGGALLNVASIASWISGPLLASYAVSKLGGLEPLQRPAQRPARAADAGDDAAHGLRRHRPDERHRRAEVDARVHRGPRLRRPGSRCRGSACR